MTATDHIELTAFVDHRSTDWTHERQLRWHPGRELVIEDDVRSGSTREFSAWLHLAPGFERIADTTFCDCEVHVDVVSSIPHAWNRGETTPLIGWRATDAGQKEAAWSGRASISGRSARLQTRVILKGECDCGV